MKLTTKKLKELIMEELAEQNLDAMVPNVDNSLMKRLEMLADHNRMSPAEKVSAILDELSKGGMLSSDPRLSQS